MKTETQQSSINQTSFRVLIFLSISHCLNDLLQTTVSASYPIFKEDLTLTFAQIGLMTLTYQLSASVFQPVMGLFFDKYPFAWSLPLGMTSTLTGILSLAFAQSLPWVLVSVALVGIGSSVLHPEASRLTSFASGGKRGLAQSLFQVGGNLGGALGPLLIAFLVAPYGRSNLSFFAIIALTAIIMMTPVCLWYKRLLKRFKQENAPIMTKRKAPLPLKKTIAAISILLLLIFSKHAYVASLSSYYTFYLIEKFSIRVEDSIIYLCIFLSGTVVGTLIGGPIGDRIGRKSVIWVSILGVAPFTLLMPHVGLTATIALSFFIGVVISSAFPAILLYAQELLPYRLGLVSGLFFGFAFGIAGIASAILGNMADVHGIETVYKVCAYMPLLGLITWFLPELKKLNK